MPKINMTNITNADNIADMVTSINQISGYWLFNGITLALFLILFILFRKFGFKTAFSSAALITAILGIFLRALNLISDLVFWAWIIAGIIGFIMIIYQND